MEYGPAACGCCGHGLADVPAAWLQKRQVFEAAPPPPPEVTEYQILAKECPACGETSIGLALAGVTGRVQYGPRVHASTALAVCSNYLPVARAAKLVAALTGVSVSAGFTAGIRGKAAAGSARSWTGSGYCCTRPACCTPTRPAGSPGTCIMSTWPARSSSPRCTLVTGRKKLSTPAVSCPATRAPSSATATRDMSTSPTRCMPGAAPDGLRDLAGLYRFDPKGRSGPRHGRPAHRRQRRCHRRPRQRARLSRRGAAGRHPCPVPRRGRQGHHRQPAQAHRDRQGRAAAGPPVPRPPGHDPAVHHRPCRRVHLESGRTGRTPVKVQMRTSGGCWRTLQGLADFAIVQLPVHRRKWGIDALDALTRLFTGQPWLPPATAPRKPRRERTTHRCPADPATRTPTRDEQAPRPRSQQRFRHAATQAE